MLAVRSFLFLVLFFAAALVLSATEFLVFWAPFRVKWTVAMAWANFSLWAGKLLCGFDVTTEGQENIPDEPAVYLIKHTTALEVYWQIAALPPHAWVLKRELLWLPVFGWALGLVMKSIAIDRTARGSAVRQVIAQGKERLAAGISVSIFPEGTRMPPGETKRYGISGAALAAEAGCKIVPVAHNAGDFWPKRDLRKYPGNVRFVIGPPIDATAQEPRETNLIAQDWIESKMREISKLYKDENNGA